MNAMRPSTLETLGLGSVFDIFRRGRLPLDAAAAVGEVFGPAAARGSLVISGVGGTVGAGKAVQLGSRLARYGVTLVGLDLPGAPDGLARQVPGLTRAFGTAQAGAILAGIVRLHYDGRTLPEPLHELRPRVLLEAIPEVLELKRAHYRVFRDTFPEIEIRSVTSGFPSHALGVGIAHPAFPHEINKVWEIVEEQPSAFTRLLWAIGLVPVPVSDHWSFVLDVLFCGLTLAALRHQRASNLPYWKSDKLVRRALGPNPFRAHDVIGATGANFLTWSCLHHLSQHYGPLFAPTPELTQRKESGQNWYPPAHLRPLVDWAVTGRDEEVLHDWVLGALIQMTSLLLHERRAHLTHINAIGELCAQFRRGILAVIREIGPDAALRRVAAYHRLHPEAAGGPWYPDTLAAVASAPWQQLYVNAEHDGTVGVVSIARESYNRDVDAELNRALDWLQAAGIGRLIVSGDFHLATQMVGADTAEFLPALGDAERGAAISRAWSATARRLHDDFRVSVGFVAGKRCLGGMLELLTHCHYLVAPEHALLGMPEVTIPVVPGMEGCHWPLRKTDAAGRAKLLRLLLTGETVSGADAVGWLVDFAGPMDASLAAAWELASHAEARPAPRTAVELPPVPALPEAPSPQTEAARHAILACVRGACAAPLAEALETQARHAGAFMASEGCGLSRA